MDKFKLDIKIESCEDDNVYMVSSRAMKCSFPVEKDIDTLLSEIKYLIEEYIDIQGSY